MPSSPRWFVVLLLLVGLAAASCATPVIPEVVSAPTPTPSPAPTETPGPIQPEGPPRPPSFEEPGLTDSTMRVGVIIDETFPVFQGESTVSAAEAVEAWAAKVNLNGGLANRQVEVVRIDTVVTEHAAAINQACNSDLFAIVGSAALLDAAGLDELVSSDCRLPDFPAQVSTSQRLTSGVTFVSNPLTADVVNVGASRFWAEQNEEAVGRAGAVYLDLQGAVNTALRSIEGAQSQGFTFAYTRAIDPLSVDYSVEAAEIIDGQVLSLTSRLDGQRFLRLLEALDAAASQDPEDPIDPNGPAEELDGENEVGEDPPAGDEPADPGPATDPEPAAEGQASPQDLLEFVDCGQRCYSDEWVAAAGDLGEGISVWLPHLPFEEIDVGDILSGSEIANYFLWLREAALAVDDEPAAGTALGLQAWSSALLFEEAVDRAVGAGTADYDPMVLTQEGVILAAGTITEWDANGIHGPANPADGIPSGCMVVLTLQAGVWERSHPTEPGTLDCEEGNLFTLTETVALDDIDEPDPGAQPSPGDADQPPGEEEVDIDPIQEEELPPPLNEEN